MYNGKCHFGSVFAVKRDNGIVCFETFYSSPNNLLFKWKKTDKLYFSDFNTNSFATTKSAIRSNKDGTIIFFYYEGDLNSEVERFEELKNAIFASTGVSWGSSLYIPSLIFKDINESKLTNLRDAKIVGIQNAGEKKFYIITGTWLQNQTEYKIWIDKDSYLIKKFIVDNSSVYTYDDIKINDGITTSVFDFQPNK